MGSPLWSFIGALAAVVAEAYLRAHRADQWFELWPAMVLGLVVNYSIFKILQTETLVGLTIVFSVFTALLRIGFTSFMSDPVPPLHWVALGLMVLANVVKGFA
jgi:hypothetical protein